MIVQEGDNADSFYIIKSVKFIILNVSKGSVSV